MRILIAFLAMSAGLVQAGELTYRVDAAVWCSGQLRGQPELLLTPGKTGSFEIDAPESDWRLTVEVEEPEEHENALRESVWFKVGIEQKIDGEWEFLTDTILGTPLGEAGRISVVDQDGSDAPDSAPLYVELTANRSDETAAADGAK